MEACERGEIAWPSPLAPPAASPGARPTLHGSNPVCGAVHCGPRDVHRRGRTLHTVRVIRKSSAHLAPSRKRVRRRAVPRCA